MCLALEFGRQYMSDVILPYRLDHLQSHVHTVLGVLWPRNGQPRNTVVAIAQNLDAQTLILLGDLIESPEQLVQRLHQIAGGQLLRQRREIDDVRVQNRHVVVALHVHLVEARLVLAANSLAGVRHLQHDAAFHLFGKRGKKGVGSESYNLY